ncbi:hypothetical protein J6590_028349 [Homalodisca vitripennis]|nr:hypothetical protein J6590_028349 [Homalodisca vitripennis]
MNSRGSHWLRHDCGHLQCSSRSRRVQSDTTTRQGVGGYSLTQLQSVRGLRGPSTQEPLQVATNERGTLLFVGCNCCWRLQKTFVSYVVSMLLPKGGGGVV